MYVGKNPSALRSMQYLEKALLSLLAVKKYQQITIKEICEKAGLSRQTFYQIFDSKDEMIRYYFSVLFEEFSERCNSFRDVSVHDIVYGFFEFFYEHRDFIRLLAQNNLIYLLEEQFELYLNKIAIFTDVNDRMKYPGFTTAFIAGGLTQILMRWLKMSFRPDIDELSLLTEKNLIMGSFDNGTSL